MAMLKNVIVSAAAVMLLTSCSSAAKTAAPGTPAGQIPASTAKHTSAAGIAGNALPTLPQGSGAAFGGAVPGGLNAHGPYSPADVTYAGNAGATPKLSSTDVLQRLRLSTSGPLMVQSVTAKRFGDVDAIAKGRLNLLTVSPDRTVYEVRTTFAAPYSIRGNTWSSGTRTFIVDAQTGDVLMGQTDGSLVHSVHVDTLHHSQGNGMRQVPPPSVVVPATGATAPPTP